MNDVALVAARASFIQNQTSLLGLKQTAQSEKAMVTMLAEAQRDLAAVTEIRGNVVNITV